MNINKTIITPMPIAMIGDKSCFTTPAHAFDDFKEREKDIYEKLEKYFEETVYPYIVTNKNYCIWNDTWLKHLQTNFFVTTKENIALDILNMYYPMYVIMASTTIIKSANEYIRVPHLENKMGRDLLIEIIENFDKLLSIQVVNE